MGWLGAGLGALLGSRGGLLSSLIGAVVGNWIENKIRDPKQPRPPPPPGSERELVVLAAIAAMLSKLAKADGRISSDEVRYCEEVFTRLGLAGEKRAYCVRVFQKAKSDSHSIYDYAASFAADQPDRETRAIVYDILWDLACTDGAVSPAELEILRNILGPLGLGVGLFEWQCRTRGVSGGAGYGSEATSFGSADPYSELGVTRSATDDAVRTAYREKAKRLHPDALRAQGLSEELLAKANEQMARLNAAWAEIRKERGL